MDILYPTRDRLPSNGRELRWSLRSLCKHFPDHGRVILAGSKPDWCVGVDWVYATDDTEHHFINQCSKMQKALSLVDDAFLAMSDDVIFLGSPDLRWRWCNSLPKHYQNLLSRSENDWYRRSTEELIKTFNHTISMVGEIPLNFSTHTPFFMRKRDAKKVLKYCLRVKGGLEPMTVYGNLMKKKNPSYQARDVKVKTLNQLDGSLILKDRYLSSGGAVEKDPRYQAFLLELFPEPCKYERQ